MPVYRGVLHVHSTFSDGDLSLVQIREMALAQSLDFVGVFDHAPRMTAESLDRMIAQCRELSSSEFLLLPGLEHDDAGRHALLIGPMELLRSSMEKATIPGPDETRRAGGLRVWAHPALTFHWDPAKDIAADYDAWEVWNRRVDGPTPSLPVLSLLNSQRAAGRQLLAAGGTDLHDGANLPPPYVLFQAGELGQASLIKALRQGRYTIEGAGLGQAWEVSSDGVCNRPHLLARIASVLRHRALRLRITASLTRHGLFRRHR